MTRVRLIIHYSKRGKLVYGPPRYGARNMAEARGYFLTTYRRRLALASAREFARHRVHRLPFIGVPRAAIGQHRIVHGAPGLGGGGPVAHQIRAVDFFAHQRQLFHARVVRVGA